MDHLNKRRWGQRCLQHLIALLQTLPPKMAQILHWKRTKHTRLKRADCAELGHIELVGIIETMQSIVDMADTPRNNQAEEYNQQRLDMAQEGQNLFVHSAQHLTQGRIRKLTYLQFEPVPTGLPKQTPDKSPKAVPSPRKSTHFPVNTPKPTSKHGSIHQDTPTAQPPSKHTNISKLRESFENSESKASSRSSESSTDREYDEKCFGGLCAR